jgi:menaquinone-dependent protoporphyrinogen IX oxidase
MFLSVSLSAAFDEGLGEAQECIARFIEQTGWTPSVSLPVAGAQPKDSWLLAKTHQLFQQIWIYDFVVWLRVHDSVVVMC